MQRGRRIPCANALIPGVIVSFRARATTLAHGLLYRGQVTPVPQQVYPRERLARRLGNVAHIRSSPSLVDVCRAFPNTPPSGVTIEIDDWQQGAGR